MTNRFRQQCMSSGSSSSTNTLELVTGDYQKEYQLSLEIPAAKGTVSTYHKQTAQSTSPLKTQSRGTFHQLPSHEMCPKVPQKCKETPGQEARIKEIIGHRKRLCKGLSRTLHFVFLLTRNESMSHIHVHQSALHKI